jgi:hypothetical protein
MQNYGSHILKRINIQAFKFVPVETLHLKMVMNQCLFEYSYGKPVGTAINFFFSSIMFCFNLNECSTGKPVGAGRTAYQDAAQICSVVAETEDCVTSLELVVAVLQGCLWNRLQLPVGCPAPVWPEPRRAVPAGPTQTVLQPVPFPISHHLALLILFPNPLGGQASLDNHSLTLLRVACVPTQSEVKAPCWQAQCPITGSQHCPTACRCCRQQQGWQVRQTQE